MPGTTPSADAAALAASDTATVVVTGVRSLAPSGRNTVRETIRKIVAGVAEVRFGGALGADTVALRAAREVGGARLVVVVPGTVEGQPVEARAAIEECADEVIELGLRLTRSSYLRRNDRLLDGATEVLAFSGARLRGGTGYTAAQARKLGLPVTLIRVPTLEAR